MVRYCYVWLVAWYVAMKVNMKKNAGGLMSPADEESEQLMLKVKNDCVYSVDIKLNQNYKLHSKMFAFFKYCSQHYFGDMEVDKDQIDYTRRQLLIAAGYTKTMIDPVSGFIEVTAKSLKYASMTPEDRISCYKKIVESALKNVFHDADESIYNQLMSFF